MTHYKTKTWMEVLKPLLNRYNDQVHSTTKTTPNNAHNLDNIIQVSTNWTKKEKHNRNYPHTSEGDFVKIFDEGKGNCVSRKERRSGTSMTGGIFAVFSCIQCFKRGERLLLHGSQELVQATSGASATVSATAEPLQKSHQ